MGQIDSAEPLLVDDTEANDDPGLTQLVNRLAQELANERRALAAATQKLGVTGRTLETRTQELTEARAALALLLATLDSATEGILAMGYFGRAMHYNTRFVEMWRIPPDKLAVLNEDALLTMQLAQVCDPAAFLDLVKARKARPDAGQSSTMELTDGRVLQCQVMPQRVRGKRVGLVTLYQDVTERESMVRKISALEAQRPRHAIHAHAPAC